jgi:hypothetical protein
MNKNYKEIEGYEGKYLISNEGKVLSVKFGKILKTSKNRHGYEIVSLGYKKRKTHYIHKLVALNFVENPFNKKTVNHIDGNKLNNNFKNLEWLTMKENINHAYEIGLKNSCIGEYHYNCKLKKTDILKIFSLKNKMNQREIADLYNVNKSTIGFILNKKRRIRDILNIENK